MKNIWFIFIFISMAIFANAKDNRPFIWVDDDNSWPMIYRDKNGNPAGIFNDIMTEIFKRLQIPLQKSVYPWKRAQKMVKNGDADGMITVYTKDRKPFTVATKPIWGYNETLFFRRDNPKACKILKINSFEDLKDLILVDTQGSGWSKEQYKLHGIKNVIWVPDNKSAFNMVAKKRADAFMTFSMDGYRIISQKISQKNALSKDYQQIIAITLTFAKLPFSLLIRKDSLFAKKVKDINRVLQEMKNDGTYQHIMSKYFGIIPIL